MVGVAHVHAIWRYRSNFKVYHCIAISAAHAQHAHTCTRMLRLKKCIHTLIPASNTKAGKNVALHCFPPVLFTNGQERVYPHTISRVTTEKSELS